MGPTHTESCLFASFWLNASADCVLETRDADLVSQTAMDAAEALLAPCARDRATGLQMQTVQTVKRPPERCSSWVH